MSDDIPDSDDVPDTEQNPTPDDVPETDQNPEPDDVPELEQDSDPPNWHELVVIPTEQLEHEMRELYQVWGRHSYAAWRSLMLTIPRVRALKEHYGGDVFAAKCRMLCRIGRTAANNIVSWGIAEPQILNEIWERVHAEAHAASVQGNRYEYPTLNKMCNWYKPEEDISHSSNAEDEAGEDEEKSNDKRSKAEISKQNLMLEDHNKTLTRQKTLLEQRLKDRDADIDHLSGLASEQRDSLAGLREFINQLKTGLAAKDEEIAAKDAEIARLREAVTPPQTDEPDPEPPEPPPQASQAVPEPEPNPEPQSPPRLLLPAPKAPPPLPDLDDIDDDQPDDQPEQPPICLPDGRLAEGEQDPPAPPGQLARHVVSANLSIASALRLLRGQRGHWDWEDYHDFAQLHLEATWHRASPDQQQRIQDYVYHATGTKALVYTVEAVIEMDDTSLELRLATWDEITERLAPAIDQRRADDDLRNRKEQAGLILATKLPAKRKLKKVRALLEELLALDLEGIGETASLGIAAIQAMQTDAEAFADCKTFGDYVLKAGQK